MSSTRIELISRGFKIKSITGRNPVVIKAEYIGEPVCPECKGTHLRTKDLIRRKLRHESMGRSNTWLEVTLRKYYCLDCGRYFRIRMQGILPYKRSTEFFRREVCLNHRDGVSKQQLHINHWIGTATVERWFHEHLQHVESMFTGRPCPRVLGIDEHFFSKKIGYVTTFCNLRTHRVFELAKGRSERALERFLLQLKGREKVRVVCIDLSSSFRSMIKKYFPNAQIVADRFHVIRTILRHFLDTWKEIDPEGKYNRGLLSLVRRHHANLSPEQVVRLNDYLNRNPVIKILYEVKETLCSLLKLKSRNQKDCKPLIKQLLYWIELLKDSNFPSMRTLGNTLDSWKNEIASMWRFTKNNAITEGLHTKMELIQRRAYGFRNFNNYRLRVITLCG